jgi:hypothetical protein
VLASGAGYFFWNKGVTKVNTGLLDYEQCVNSSRIINLVIWNKADIKKILIGGSLIFASLA